MVKLGLKEALGFDDVRVLDHIVSGTAEATSMAEPALLLSVTPIRVLLTFLTTRQR